MTETKGQKEIDFNFPLQIKIARTRLKETQTEFGKRFNRSATAVSLWESGAREASYKVLYFVKDIVKNYKVCDKCQGEGWVK